MVAATDYTQGMLVRKEARQLDAAGQECYRATSAGFSGQPEQTLFRPHLDEARLAAGLPRPSWPGGAAFAVCLTHDVDHVSWVQPRAHGRRLRNHFLPAVRLQDWRAVRGLRSAAVEYARALTRRKTADPLHCFERWLQVERSVGARSTFLFLPERYGKRHYSDGCYRYSDRLVFDGQACSVGEMMRELHRRGWEVGLHASWQSFNCGDEMRRQKEQVERMIDAAVISVRHHYLHFDVRCTPGVHQQAGLLVDSSLGFNDGLGFRCGSSYPWQLRDLRSEQELDVLELPLIVQDKCLLRRAGTGQLQSAVQWAALMAERVQAVGGVLTLLWHPCSIRHPLYLAVYEQVLSLLQRRQAWFGTMAEIADWWRKGGLA